MTQLSNQERFLRAALTAVGEACQVARRVQNELGETRRILKSDKSPVTVADFAAQSVIIHRLCSELGETLVAGEESSGLLQVPEQAGVREAVVESVRAVWPEVTTDQVLDAIDGGNHDATAPAFWTLDPIDGTKGFLRGGQYAISLAYIEQGKVVLGVMGCPNLSADFDRPFSDPDPAGLIYYATRGGGAWVLPADDISAPPTRVVPIAAGPEASIRVCESVESSHSRQDETARIIEALGGAGTPARLDSQCKYAVVARGQADAYLRMPTRADYVENIWDHAAGMIIAEEAGMVVTDIHGRPLDFSQGRGLTRNQGIVCASPRWHGRIIAALGSKPA
jgi:3'(2'), 5'-bisphosphate nucleotidase